MIGLLPHTAKGKKRKGQNKQKCHHNNKVEDSNLPKNVTKTHFSSYHEFINLQGFLYRLKCVIIVK